MTNNFQAEMTHATTSIQAAMFDAITDCKSNAMGCVMSWLHIHAHDDDYNVAWKHVHTKRLGQSFDHCG